ncbi:hypothetical protein O7606_24360 [Micromonospora sp. WMMD882]|uniref:hypothetical protein n=1 Tax=Micromonospora sp. WMMD882 TaxID=3015151 RepID=UPI00248D25CD|nr:hypothetical protein [Micromonospora sp. WMMD882]WBB79268.1 hypothetical protein O7606_24360 [Micromonospora sp. WMMD882]
MMISRSRVARTAAGLAAVAATLLVSPGPAQAFSSPAPRWDPIYSEGPFGSQEECLRIRDEFRAIGYVTGKCGYRDLSGTVNDGWYFNHAGTPPRPE